MMMSSSFFVVPEQFSLSSLRVMFIWAYPFSSADSTKISKQFIDSTGFLELCAVVTNKEIDFVCITAQSKVYAILGVEIYVVGCFLLFGSLGAPAPSSQINHIELLAFS